MNGTSAPFPDFGSKHCRSDAYLIGSTAIRGEAFIASLIAAMSFAMMPFTFATA